MTTNGAPTWDLESIFPGGSRSVEFGRFREEIREKLASAASLLSQLVSAQGQKDFGGWARFVLELQTLYDYLRQASSFVGCLVSQNVDDEEAHRLDAEISALIAEWSSLLTGLEEFSTKLSDSEWAAFIEAEGMPAVEFFLNKLRDDARAKMAPELERLVLSLAVDGYHAWHRLYDKMAGDLRVEFEEGGKKEVISLGQLAEKSRSPDREVRRQAFDKLNDAWRSRADLAAMALNAQAGFRLAVYKGRNWKSPLEEPLRINRMKRETLDAMWSVVGQAGSRLKPYVEAKKRLLGIDKFKW